MKNLCVVLAVVTLAGCAKRAPLPGDSVSLDGAVAVAPPRASAVAPPREPLGAVESRVFPPELLMENQATIGLDERQRALVMSEVERAQSEMTKLRWDLEREREALVKLLDAHPADEPAVSAAAKRMTDLESRIKAVHLTMLIRVKNALSAEQLSKLRQLR